MLFLPNTVSKNDVTQKYPQLTPPPISLYLQNGCLLKPTYLVQGNLYTGEGALPLVKSSMTLKLSCLKKEEKVILFIKTTY